jgi:sigma-B regulation protein RsbU (phosphoserine phosphatase)
VAVGSIDDPQRLEAVRRAALIDTDPEVVFDELTKAASRLLNAPFAFMTVVDETRSFWKSTVGVDDGTRSNAVEDSFCQYVVGLGDGLFVGDASADALTSENPSIESMGVRAWAGCPIVLDEQVLGTFCVVDQRVRDWTDDDRAILGHLAEIASREVAMRAERDAESEQRVAAVARNAELSELLDIVRASLLPPSVPNLPGIDLAAWFEPARSGELLLGDFYDAFPVDGRRWAIVVGDVCGHGAHAAKLTAMIRYTLRSAMVHHADPADALGELDRAIRADQLDTGRFATLCVFGVGLDGDQLDVTWARAGHTLPILVPADGPGRALDGAGGPPVGLLRPIAAPWTTERRRLGPGDALVVYTDGVTEARGVGGVLLGTDGLVDAIAGHRGSVTELVDRIEEHTLARGGLSDDALVLAFGPTRPR